MEHLSSRCKAQLQNGGKTVTHKTKQQWVKRRRKMTNKPIKPSFSQHLTKNCERAKLSKAIVWLTGSIQSDVMPNCQTTCTYSINFGQAPFFIKYKGNIYDSTWNSRMMVWKSRTLYSEIPTLNRRNFPFYRIGETHTKPAPHLNEWLQAVFKDDFLWSTITVNLELEV